MEANGVDVDKIIEIRRDIHKHAEIAFEEHRTHKVIKDTLLSWGLKEDDMWVCAKTGLVCDIKGTGPVVADEKNDSIKCVALRADIDALPMPEHNEGLEWITTTKYAHMCGHDGHITMLLAGAQVMIKNRDKIPSNKSVRLLW